MENNKEKIVVFIHAAILGRCALRLNQYFDLMKSSGLYDACEKVYVNYVGTGEFPINVDKFFDSSKDENPKIVFRRVSEDLLEFELPTHVALWNFAKENPGYKILYIHTKGIHIEINQCIEDWVSYMIHFNIGHWASCVERLNFYKTCGVDLRRHPTLHYSGNFWWATSDHIASLPDPVENMKRQNPVNSPRHNQEFWLCVYRRRREHTGLWESHINCYQRHLHLYPRERYDPHAAATNNSDETVSL
jgi:hypothetical protein